MESSKIWPFSLLTKNGFVINTQEPQLSSKSEITDSRELSLAWLRVKKKHDRCTMPRKQRTVSIQRKRCYTRKLMSRGSWVLYIFLLLPTTQIQHTRTTQVNELGCSSPSIHSPVIRLPCQLYGVQLIGNVYETTYAKFF